MDGLEFRWGGPAINPSDIMQVIPKYCSSEVLFPATRINAPTSLLLPVGDTRIDLGVPSKPDGVSIFEMHPEREYRVNYLLFKPVGWSPEEGFSPQVRFEYVWAACETLDEAWKRVGNVYKA